MTSLHVMSAGRVDDRKLESLCVAFAGTTIGDWTNQCTPKPMTDLPALPDKIQEKCLYYLQRCEVVESIIESNQRAEGD